MKSLIMRLGDALDTVAALPTFTGKQLVLRAIREAIENVSDAEGVEV